MKTFCLVTVLLAMLAPPAVAELGGKATPAVAGQNRIQAVQRRAPSTAYSVQESTTDDGGTIREFVAPSGEVFGVAWNSPRMPNLQQLFGSHFQALRDEQAAREPGRRPVRIDRSDLVVESGGHPRAFRGRAYLPQRVPAGVSTDDIK